LGKQREEKARGSNYRNYFPEGEAKGVSWFEGDKERDKKVGR
jgi:hypothetical protein